MAEFVNSKFWRWLAGVFVLLIFVNTVMGIVSFVDRRQLNALVESRQKIGLAVIRAGERASLFTAEEKRRICDAWRDSRYDRTGEQCPK